MSDTFTYWKCPQPYVRAHLSKNGLHSPKCPSSASTGTAVGSIGLTAARRSTLVGETGSEEHCRRTLTLSPAAADPTAAVSVTGRDSKLLLE